MKPILVDKDYMYSHLSAGIYLFTFLNLSPLELAIKDVLNNYPQKKTLCFNFSPYELNIPNPRGNIEETHRFYTGSETINTIRKFCKDENAEFVIINSYLLLDAQEKWFLNNLLGVAYRFDLKIIILETVPTHYKHLVPKHSKIKKHLNIPYNYSNKVYYILPVGECDKDFQNSKNHDYEVYKYK